MKRNIFLIVFIIITINSFSYAQYKDTTEIKKSSIYFELGGNSLFYSFNFDYVFYKSGNTKLLIGSGISFIPGELLVGGGNELVISPNINLLLGGNNNLELGTGFAIFSDGTIATARVGYRYQPEKGGILFRIGFTPLFARDFIAPFVGISIGYTIK